MLQLLIGRSGSGKSTVVFDRIETLVQQGHERVFLIVPEQYSFETERTLLMRLGAQRANRVQVLSFTRLADTVFREVGGLAGEQLDDGIRALLMSRALDEVAALARDAGEPLMGADPRLVTDSAYVEQLLVLWGELRQCAVSLEELTRAEEELAREDTLAERGLQEKVKDLSRIFAVYEGLIADSGLEEADKLTRLAAALPDSRLLDSAAVMVLGFKGFTVQELTVLDRLIPRVEEMVVSLTTDTPGAKWSRTLDHSREFTLFSPVTDTIEHLKELADGHHRQWELCLQMDNRRNPDGALCALEAGLYAPAPTIYDGAADAVTVIPCRDIYVECDVVARRIRCLLREEGYRLRDITVVARNLTDYRGLLEDALEQEGIAYSMDARQDLLDEPLIVYLRTALRVAVGGLRTEEILRLLKTDLSCLDAVQIAELENYVYMWGIDGAAWESDWVENPAGLGAPVTPHTARQLAELNAWRQQIVEPLSRLREALRGGAYGRGFALAVYRYLTDDGELPTRILRQVSALEELDEPLLAQHAARLWDELVKLLDRFAVALRDTRLSAVRLEELFTMLAQTIDIGQIPQGLDAVTVGSADRIRYHHPRAVFMLGMNEGVFPAYPDNAGLLTADDRQRLEECGIKLSSDLLTQSIEERYYAYMAVAAPSERLILTYHTEGESVPSPIVTAVQKILPNHTRGVAVSTDGRDLESGEAMFTRLAREYTRSTPTTESLRQVLADETVFSGRLAAVERSVGRGEYRLADAGTARGLFGADLRLSASQTDKFYQCHFSYFCRYGLSLYPRKRAQVDAAFFGTIVHYVMETLLPRYVAAGALIDRLKATDEARQEMSKEEVEQAENALQTELLRTVADDVHAVVMAYAAEQMGGADNKSGRFLYQLQLAERSACNMLWHTVMELRQSAFAPTAFELGIVPDEKAPEGAIESMRISFPRGSVRLIGKVDRVDLFVRFDGKAFVRVVDYKTGTKTFDLNELSAGLNMQMLLYLYNICDHPERFNADGVQPAGVLYHPLSDLIIDRKAGAKSQTERLKSMKMDGIVLDDASVVQAMERDNGKLFIPAEIAKDGKPKGSVITEAQFGLLRGVVEQLLVNMANDLLDGDIAALPIQRGEYTPCTYCDYRAVCARDEDDPTAMLTERSAKQVLEELEQTAGEVSDGE